MLEITNLRKKYGGFALGPIDLTLEPGTVHGLIGPNGAGKTTLFRTVMGTVRRDQGLVKVGGRKADASSGEWKRTIGYIGDYTPLFEHWSGARNLQAFAAFYDNWSEESAQSMASRLELDLSQKVGAYSTGQRTKLAIILALAHHPTLLLLDEPANGLDPVTRDTFMEVLFEQMSNEELTVLYATHHISEIERIVDQLIFISDGRILAHERVDTLLENWRRITFRTSQPIGDVPHQVSRVREGDDHQVTTSSFQRALWFLESQGVECIETSMLTTEQICVHVLRNGAGREKLHD
jgi:ABC-2 type transport system ATP-binding protein